MIIDRIESDFAIIENGEQRLIVPLTDLPPVKEGDRLIITDGKYIVNNENISELQQKIKQREQALLNKKRSS
ncbi:hypothetical protein FACS1894132_03810 [Clostridia bacterium]|nr:hypothetical protein FACS1894132_03810 [Clostridia bacterium]